jgi:hypothetical protein
LSATKLSNKTTMQVLATRTVQPRDKPANAQDIQGRDQEEFESIHEAGNMLDTCQPLFFCLHWHERVLTEVITRQERRLLEAEARLSKCELGLADQEEAMKRHKEELQQQFETQ